MTSPEGIAVELLSDMRRYHASLAVGTRGVAALQPTGNWTQNRNPQVEVKFADVRLDVLWRDLRIVDERILAEQRRQEQELVAAFESGHVGLEKIVGPRGGVRQLNVQVDGRVEPVTDRKEIPRYLGLAEKHGVDVKERRA